MNYSEEEFVRLVEKVEFENGQLLDHKCSPRTFEFTGSSGKPVTLGYCGLEVSFEIPYEATNAQGDEIGVHPVRACAVDDNIGLWPRFLVRREP